MAALWCADESGVLPIFLLAAAVHECGHLFVIRLSGGTVHALCLTACGAVLRCSLPPSSFSRAAICLAGPAASFALTALANPLGAYRLAGASALLGLFNLLPVPPARRRHGAPAPRGRTVYTPAERDCGRVRSRPPCGRRPPVEVGIWRVAVSRWIDGRRFLWTRITAGANIVRPRTVRFYAVRGAHCAPLRIACTKSLNLERRGRTAWHLFLRRCRTSPCRSLTVYLS